eukprot:2517236-Alexandrium_andersonii.AAC.1
MLPRGVRRRSRCSSGRGRTGARGHSAASPSVPAGIERGPEGRQRRPGLELDGWPAPRNEVEE